MNLEVKLNELYYLRYSSYFSIKFIYRLETTWLMDCRKLPLPSLGLHKAKDSVDIINDIKTGCVTLTVRASTEI